MRVPDANLADPLPASTAAISSVLPYDAIALTLASIARDAGALLLSLQAEVGRGDIKPDGSPVCRGDLCADDAIHAALSAQFPGIPIISEEREAAHRTLPARRFFLVDPLDGTKAYLAGLKDYCVLIALIEDGVAKAGALAAPALGEHFRAGETVIRAQDGESLAGETFRPRPHNPTPVAILSTNHAREACQSQSARLGAKAVRYENSALKFARLASGEADFYPRNGRTMQWDVAAGDALLRPLGGGVLDQAGQPLRYGYGPLGWANPEFVAYRRLP